MKNLYVALILSLSSVSGFGQGSLVLTLAGYVYGVDPSHPTSPILSEGREKLSGEGYSAQLFWGVAGASEADMKGIPSAYFTFLTGSDAGRFLHSRLLKISIPGAWGGDKLSLQVRAWDNRGGAVTGWADVFGEQDLPRGYSNRVIDYELAGLDADNIPHVGSGNASIKDFGLYYIVPEPAALCLASLGLSVLLFRHRKTQRTSG